MVITTAEINVFPSNLNTHLNSPIEGEAELQAFFEEYLKNPHPTDDTITYEGMRRVLGGNGSGTIDGFAPFAMASYELFIKDFVTIADPNASFGESTEALLAMTPVGKLAKGGKTLKILKHLDSVGDVTKNTRAFPEITQKDIEQLGDYIQKLDKGTGNLNDPYIGVKQASEYLKSQGVPRQFRKTTLESFEIGTIRLDVAGSNTYGLRFYDDINASAKGRYLFETFSPQVNRSNLALPPDWNRMTGIQQWKVKPDTIIIKGKAGSQFQMGDQYIGGVEQWYITNLESLIKP
ncbi:hypothetical protein [Lysinibacillus sp. 54212]|uniref:hypothetical protein n=1 Tax=Lysinibacillus sp. 54212 TaxID=3119829 RepID=UPI002FCB02A4